MDNNIDKYLTEKFGKGKLWIKGNKCRWYGKEVIEINEEIANELQRISDLLWDDKITEAEHEKLSKEQIEKIGA